MNTGVRDVQPDQCDISTDRECEIRLLSLVGIACFEKKHLEPIIFLYNLGYICVFNRNAQNVLISSLVKLSDIITSALPYN
jgi:hypothetical protein